MTRHWYMTTLDENRWDGTFSGDERGLLCSLSWLALTVGIFCRVSQSLLLTHPNVFRVIDIVLPFLSTISSSLEDDTTSLSAH